MEELDKEILVDKSGVKMWLDAKSYRDKIKNNKIEFIIFLVLILIITSLSIGIVSKQSTNSSLVEKNTELTRNNKVLKSSTDAAEQEAAYSDRKLTDCKLALDSAWRAWDRRNQLIITILNNIFGGKSEAVEEDNKLAGQDFALAQECDPSLDANDIFTK